MTENPVCNEETPPPPQPLPTPPPQTSRPQRFSALVAKLRDVTELDDDCFAGYKWDESNTDTSDNDSDSGDSDDEVYIWPL